MANNPSSPQAPVIIIRKKKGGGHGGHHGGAWKVAYADFVTAMMSLFLLLWLLNVTIDVERQGIADYFAPANDSKSESGAGGIFGGQTITSDGAQVSAGSPPTTQDVTIPTVGQGDQGEEDTKGKDQGAGEGKATAGPDVNNANNQSGTNANNAVNNISKDIAAMANAM